MINRINEFITGLMLKVDEVAYQERGQTSAEYVAVTAVAVLIAIGIIYATISGAINAAASNIFTNLTSWISSQFAGA